MINIGQIIKNHCRQNGMPLYKLASQVKVNHTTLYKSLKDNDMPLSRLYSISNFLNHNFFIYFIQNTEAKEEKLLKLSTENKELTTKVASLQKEITYLLEINSLLKARQP